jgi:hypothetical protein
MFCPEKQDYTDGRLNSSGRNQEVMTMLRLSKFMLGAGLAIFLGLQFAPSHVVAADVRPIVGDWEGTLNPGAQPKKRIVVHISAAQDGTLGGTLDFPDDDSSGVLMTAITYKEPALHFESTASLVAYDGTMSKGNLQISGTWKQAGKSLDLVLKRTP